MLSISQMNRLSQVYWERIDKLNGRDELWWYCHNVGLAFSYAAYLKEQGAAAP